MQGVVEAETRLSYGLLVFDSWVFGPTLIVDDEWGHDDYSLEIENLWLREPEEGTADGTDERRFDDREKKVRKFGVRKFGKGKAKSQGLMLLSFDVADR